MSCARGGRRDLVGGMAKRKVKVPASMGPAPDVESFVELFAQLPDPRVERTRRHSLESVLFLCLCGVVCGANDLVSIERFGNARQSLLEQFVEFPEGIPSHDTLGRVLAKLDPAELESLFARWMNGVAEATTQGVVAIDGKVLRRAFNKANGGNFITMVSAWSTANGLVLGQVGTSEGSNEIEAIPRLLKLLHLKGCLVTIDAAGCQTAIAEKIVDGGGDYLLAVRDNQPKLHEAVATALETFRSRKKSPGAKQHASTTETSRGREEKRRCWVLPISDEFPEAARWKGLGKLVLFESERTVAGKTSIGARYFITSRKSLTAKQALASVRSHWEIENKLHWTLDAAFGEDDSRLRADNAAENFAVVRHVALNLLRNVKGSKVGIKNRRLEAGWNERFLLKVLSSYAD
ncbi:MAG: ISAs1 family transposase [Nannocystaceae bacterium]|nr:ISAs1 family transposase [Nannocystaceae bacterium]